MEVELLEMPYFQRLARLGVADEVDTIHKKYLGFDGFGIWFVIVIVSNN